MQLDRTEGKGPRELKRDVLHFLPVFTIAGSNPAWVGTFLSWRPYGMKLNIPKRIGLVLVRMGSKNKMSSGSKIIFFLFLLYLACLAI